MPKKNPLTADDLLEVLTRLDDTVQIVKNVAKKFPHETLPPELRAFLRVDSVTLAFTGVHEDYVRILGGNPAKRFHSLAAAKLPIAWLDMSQGELASAVRDIYWEASAAERQRQLSAIDAQLADSETQAEKLLERAERAQEQAREASFHAEQLRAKRDRLRQDTPPEDKDTSDE